MSGYFSVFKTLGTVLKGNKSKVSPTIKSVKPNVPKTKTEKAKSKLAIAKQNTKGSQAKLNQAIFNLQEQNREFKKAREAREKKMGGGMMGRRFGMKMGTPKPKTNVQKINETFAPKNKNLKPVDPKKQKGLSKLPRQVRNKMGYMKSGGRAGFKHGTPLTRTRPRPDEKLDPNNPINKKKKEFKQEAEKDMK